MSDEYVFYKQDQIGTGLCWDFASSLALSTTVMKATNEYNDYSELWTSLACAKKYDNYLPCDGQDDYKFYELSRQYGIVHEQNLQITKSFFDCKR